MHHVVCVAFGGMHHIFNLVQQVGRNEIGMLPNEVIDIIFHHVFPVRIALPAYVVYFVTNCTDCANAAAIF